MGAAFMVIMVGVACVDRRGADRRNPRTTRGEFEVIRLE